MLKRLSLIGTGLLWLLLLSAQKYVYEPIGITEGMSQGMAFDMCQTRDGFLWIATKDGLNRYDGYNFKVFNHNPFTNYTITEDYCTSLLEDQRGLLWIGLASQGINVYDARTGRFHHIYLKFDHIVAHDYNLFRLYESSDGSIWVLQRGNGLAQIKLPDTWSNYLPNYPELSNQVSVVYYDLNAIEVPKDNIVNIWEYPRGTMVVCSKTQRLHIDMNTHAVQPAFNPFAGEVVWQIEYDGDNEWALIGEKYVKRARQGKLISATPWLANWEQDLSCLVKDKASNQLWVSFQSYIWQVSEHNLAPLPTPTYAMDRTVTKVLTDRSKNIWIGTNGYGIRKISPLRQFFNATEGGNSVWRVWCSPKGAYFWGRLAVISKYDPLTGVLSKSSAFPEAAHLWQRDLIFEADGSCWLLAFVQNKDGKGGWLYHYDPAGRLTEKFFIDLDEYVYSQLYFDSSGTLWITGTQGKLLAFNRLTGQITPFSYGYLFGENAISVYPTDMVEVEKGKFWLATQLGLIRAEFDGHQFKFNLFQVENNQQNGLNCNSISCLLPDPFNPKEVLWIGTKGGGINRLDTRNGQITHISVDEGLPDRIVYGMLPGNEPTKNGRVSLWCSTNRGLAQVLIGTQSAPFNILTYTVADGLQDNEFNTLAFTKSQKGELLFGGVNGINRFTPDSLQVDSTGFEVKIVGMRANLSPVDLPTNKQGQPQAVEFLRQIRLDYGQNDFMFEFAALDFTDPAKTRYRYRMAGLGHNWVDIGHNHTVQFNRLPPGTYTFQVQANNGNGIWRESVPVTVFILPPWYKSPLAWVVYGLLLILALWGFQQAQLQRLRVNDQLAAEQREKVRIAAMERMKTNFFNNITHEFRTPLTLIIEPIKRLLAKPLPPELAQQAVLIEHNSQQLLGLVNQLLDLAKLEGGQMQLDYRMGDLNDLLQSTYRRFIPLAEQQNIDWSLQVEAEIAPFVFDAAKVEIILNNLLSNAFKFVPPSGSVELICRRIDPAPGSPIQLMVTDTGMGIPLDEQHRVFDRFFQSAQIGSMSGKGTGIGLALSLELAELMGGKLWLSESSEKGTCFILSLPVNTSLSNQQPLAGIAEPDLSTLISLPMPTPDQLPPEDLPVLLIVEDNADLRTYLKSVLIEKWHILEAANGLDGVLLAREHLPEMVISDVMMPGKNGFELCEALKSDELTAHIPVILLTAKSDQPTKLSGLALGADDYLSKPFDTPELLLRVQNMLEMRRKLRALWQVPGLTHVAPEQQPELSALNRAFMDRLMQVIEQQHTDPDLSVERLAQLMFMSRVQLFRKVKALTGQTVSDLIRDYRLDKAKTMLERGEGRVYEIAERVGFGNEKYFSTAFKARFGITPSQI
jgi:signal transduction histidine kinase/DNA-binding response OmpR family regulator